MPENFYSLALALQEYKEQYLYSYCPLRFSIFYLYILL
jgi:hypothetical protein